MTLCCVLSLIKKLKKLQSGEGKHNKCRRWFSYSLHSEVEHSSSMLANSSSGCCVSVEQSAERSLPARCWTAHYSSKHEFIKAGVMNKKIQGNTRKKKESAFSLLEPKAKLFPAAAWSLMLLPSNWDASEAQRLFICGHNWFDFRLTGVHLIKGCLWHGPQRCTIHHRVLLRFHFC